MKKSATFKAYLDTMAKFWKYSYRNQILIHSQKPDASKIAGFRAWKKLGRNVKKGSKSIKIMAPFTKLDQEEKAYTFFIPVSVFDISQTEGEELPILDIRLEGDDQKQLFDSLLAFCKTKNIEVDFKDFGVNGLYGYSQGGIVKISSKDNINTQVNTLVHEIAHELLHHPSDLSKLQKEIQAEGTAYVVCKHFRLATKSFTYLALYEADADQILENFEAIAVAGKQVIEFVGVVA